jgi:hypothetical protein
MKGGGRRSFFFDRVDKDAVKRILSIAPPLIAWAFA